tara:strand:- start:1175 stop:1597 length:423 start_codon:yes stop_codon:yes gene_type:complete
LGTANSEGVSRLTQHREVDAGTTDGLGWGGGQSTLTVSLHSLRMPSTNGTVDFAPQPSISSTGDIIGFQICMASLEVSGNHVLIISTSLSQGSRSFTCHIYSSIVRVVLSSVFESHIKKSRQPHRIDAGILHTSRVDRWL